MNLSHARAAVSAIVLATAAISAPPARAETPEELDVLSDRAVNEQAGIALAQEQAARGEWLEAVATLERVLAANPKSSTALFLHASYLCRVDDRLGGTVELGKLRKKDHAKQDLDALRVQCAVPGQG